jgi:hypothetical protein|nr:MAG TPA: hypothetical protein [Caudoviricetes sp.]
MNLFQVIVHINDKNKPTVLDIRNIIGSIVNGNSIYIKGKPFFIECFKLSDKVVLQALYNDMCCNEANYKDDMLLMMSFRKIDVKLYRLQKISRTLNPAFLFTHV